MKKGLSKNVLALLALLFIIMSFGMNYAFYQSLSTPTGKAVGEIRFCINHPPTLSLACEAEVNFDQAYFCDIDSLDQDANSVTFYDNTSLFDIGLSTGLINFTPTSPQTGSHSINISVEDNSGCTNNMTYSILNITVLGSFIEVIVNTTANISTTIDVTDNVDALLEIVTASNVSNSSLNISKSVVNPTPQSLPVTALGKYLTINASKNLERNITNSKIRIYYTDDELAASLLHELSLRMYYFNQSWQRVTTAMNWVYETGRNTTDQGSYSGYFWANTTHLSIYSIGGLLVDDSSCSLAAQCYGGYCCSSACSSSRCPVAEPAAAGGGGGGLIIEEVEADFSLSEGIITVSLEQGRTQRESFSITNTGITTLTFKINLGNLRKFMLIGANNFKLKPGETKTIQLDFIAPGTQEPDLISGAIVVSGGAVVKLIRVFLEIESALPLFDIGIELIQQEIHVGEELNAIVTLYSMKDMGRVDVFLETQIKDEEGKIIFSLSETLAVSEKTSVLVRFNVPENLKAGNYIIYSRVRYNGLTGSSSRLFTILEKPLIEMPKGIRLPSISSILVAVQISFTLLIFIMLLYVICHGILKTKKEKEILLERKEKPEKIIKEKPEKMIEERPVKKVEQDIAVLKRGNRVYELKDRLEERLKFIEESFRSNLMNRQTYLKEKRKIEEKLEKL